MALKSVLSFGASLLCLCVLQTSGQSVAIFPPSVSGQVGESVTIFCVAGLVQDDNSLELFNTTLSTFINYETSMDGRERLTRVDDPNNNTLTSYTISPLRSTDNGAVFRCGDVGGTSTISVIFAPIINPMGELGDPAQVTEGDTATIAFSVSANPPPSFMWMINGKVVVNDSVRVANAYSIVLNPANRSHAGMYRLVVNNSVGTTDYNFTLDVLFGPEFPPNQYIIPSDLNNKLRGDIFVVAVTPGQDVTLVCNAVGNPTPSVTQVIPQGSTATNVNNNIYISGAASADAGNYTCTSNGVTRGFQVFVGGVPQNVRRVNVTIVPPNANVTWEYDDSVNDVPALYFIGNVTRTDGSNVTMFQVPASVRSAIIPLSTFVSGQEYTASIAVRNLQGVSEIISSEPFTFTGHGNMLVATPLSIIALLILAIAASY